MLDALIFGKVTVGFASRRVALAVAATKSGFNRPLDLDIALTPHAAAYLARAAHMSFRW